MRFNWLWKFNTTFNNISSICWHLALFKYEIWVPKENNWPVTGNRQNFITKLYEDLHLVRSRHKTQNFRSDMHWLNRSKKIQLPYDHSQWRPWGKHEGPQQTMHLLKVGNHKCIYLNLILVLVDWLIDWLVFNVST